MVFINILLISGNISSDQTGQLHVTSIRVGKYIMVMAEYDSESIPADPLTPLADTEILRTFTKLYDHLNERA